MGSDSIRAYDVVERFRDRICKIADFANESVFVEITINRHVCQV